SALKRRTTPDFGPCAVRLIRMSIPLLRVLERDGKPCRPRAHLHARRRPDRIAGSSLMSEVRELDGLRALVTGGTKGTTARTAPPGSVCLTTVRQNNRRR